MDSKNGFPRPARLTRIGTPWRRVLALQPLITMATQVGFCSFTLALDQRVLAAFRAISVRCSGVSLPGYSQLVRNSDELLGWIESVVEPTRGALSSGETESAAENWSLFSGSFQSRLSRRPRRFAPHCDLRSKRSLPNYS